VRLRRETLPRIYALTDREAAARPHADIVGELVAAGIHWIQIREKSLSDAELFADVERAVMSLPAEVRLIVNDRLDIALAASADGVHLGDGDLPPAIARQVPGAADLIVGFSTHSVEEALAAADDEAVDYLAIGPIFRSPTKNVREPLGSDVIRRIRAATVKPIVAIGGIEAANIGQVLDAGADMAAVLSALYRGGSLRDGAEALVAAAGESR
jgi:thiamine-phosphate pyrophosphorylase